MDAGKLTNFSGFSISKFVYCHFSMARGLALSAYCV